MRIRLEGKKLRLALALLAIAVIAFGFSWTIRSTTATRTCVTPGRTDPAIQQCVGDQAARVEATPITLTLLLVGGLALGAAILIAARAARRVMTIPEAAATHGVPPGQIRRLIEAGILDVSERDGVSTYLDPEQVRRLSPAVLPKTGLRNPARNFRRN